MRPRSKPVAPYGALCSFALPAPGTERRLDALRRARLSRLLQHTARHVPFYRETLARAGGNLASMPILKRETVRDRYPELLVEGADLSRNRRHLTSGTTGIPIQYPASPAETMVEHGLWTKLYAHCGLRPWHIQAKFAFSAFMPAGPRAIQRMGLFRRKYFPMEAPPDEKIAWLKREKPDALFAWASVLDEISRRLEDRGERLHIPLIFSTSTSLFPPVRERVAARMGGRVFDVYGAVESGPIAWECPEGGYHVRHDSVVLEIVDEDGRAARNGRVVCTPLWRYTMPLLRLELGDGAEWRDAPCRCGVPGRGLAALHGRTMDLVQLDGKDDWIAPFRLMRPMYELPGIRQFQCIQEAPDLFAFHVVPGLEFTADSERKIEAHFAREFGGRIRSRMVLTPSIPATKSGKPLMLMTLARLKAQPTHKETPT